MHIIQQVKLKTLNIQEHRQTYNKQNLAVAKYKPGISDRKSICVIVQQKQEVKCLEELSAKCWYAAYHNKVLMQSAYVKCCNCTS